MFGLIVIFVALALFWGGPLVFAQMFFPTSIPLAYACGLIGLSVVAFLWGEVRAANPASVTGSAGWGEGGATLMIWALAISNIIPLIGVGLYALFW